ncbi:MAG: endonuclease/exonuclease/phosphatase family protein [Phycisphaerales bacterium]
MSTPHLRRVCGTILTAWLLALAGCASGPRATSNAVKGLLNVTLDGDTREWPAESAVAADDQFVYLRMSVEQEQFTLQSAPESMVLLLDCDASTATGRTSELQPLDRLGVDLEVRFSPMEENGRRKNGVKITSFDAYGTARPVPLSDLDFVCSPTYASSWYEARISRTPSEAGLIPFSGMRSEGALSGLWVIEDAAGKVVGYSDPFTLPVAPAAEGPMRFTADLPVKPEGALRVMTLNVEHTGPVKNPQVFARLFQAIDPDVLLLQEWEEGDGESVTSWFTALMNREGGWHVHKPAGSLSSGGGVVVVSKYPLTPVLERLTSSSRSDKGEVSQKPVRLAAARIQTPLGPMIAGSAHLKCCGTKDSREDKQRMEEGKSIATAIRAATSTQPNAIRVIGGDLNLVGSRPPLDLLRAGADGDGSDLSVVDAFVLGDRSMYTWGNDASGFAPGRLDYIVHSDANTRVVNSFVLDTTRLSTESLARLGLDATDSAATDHRPVVVDLLPK